MSADSTHRRFVLPRPAATAELALAAFALVVGTCALATLFLAGLTEAEHRALTQGGAAAARRAELIQSLVVSLVLLGVTATAAAAWLFVRRLREADGWITVCAWTRRVQWQGRWVSFEEYLAQRFNQRCTHGICDEAAEKLKMDVANIELAASELRQADRS